MQVNMGLTILLTKKKKKKERKTKRKLLCKDCFLPPVCLFVNGNKFLSKLLSNAKINISTLSEYYKATSYGFHSANKA